MRQAIRVYAIVALVVMVAFVAGLWARPYGVVLDPHDTLGLAVFYLYGLQAWVLLLIPLGVLAASDAGRAGRRGWLALFAALLVIAPLGAWSAQLTDAIQNLLIGPCVNGGPACAAGSPDAPDIITQAAWIVAFLPIPIAALSYTFAPATRVARQTAADFSQGERRALIVWSVIGAIVMAALGYLGTTQWSFESLVALFGYGSFEQTATIFNIQGALSTFLFVLAALPVAVASMALAHAAQTARRGWLAGWIALAVLTLLTLDLGTLWGVTLIGAMTGAQSSDQMPFLAPMLVISIVTPVVVMLVALVYALVVMRPESRARFAVEGGPQVTQPA